MCGPRGRRIHYDIGQPEYLVRTDVRRHDEQERPYAHPYYWAAFQVDGWQSCEIAYCQERCRHPMALVTTAPASLILNLISSYSILAV